MPHCCWWWRRLQQTLWWCHWLVLLGTGKTVVWKWYAGHRKTPFRPLTVRVISVCKHHADPSNASVSDWASCRAGNSAASIAPLWSKNRPADATPGSSKNISGIVIDLGKPAVHAMAAFWGALGSSVVVGGTKALLFLIVVSQVIGGFGRAWIIGCTAPRSQSGNIAMLDLSVAICSAVSTTMALWVVWNTPVGLLTAVKPSSLGQKNGDWTIRSWGLNHQNPDLSATLLDIMVNVCVYPNSPKIAGEWFYMSQLLEVSTAIIAIKPTPTALPSYGTTPHLIGLQLHAYYRFNGHFRTDWLEVPTIYKA